mmetsp:Transcript_4235/g.10799  ORF Transcript_4235/g.10799 Transcript_4235/m.10799 type:complete len:117 (+) Transcript_4235:2110-2460(+)
MLAEAEELGYSAPSEPDDDDDDEGGEKDADAAESTCALNGGVVAGGRLSGRQARRLGGAAGFEAVPVAADAFDADSHMAPVVLVGPGTGHGRTSGTRPTPARLGAFEAVRARSPPC